MPHDCGHCFAIKCGFSSHSPALTHPAHDSWRSAQTVVHRPHDLEHSRAMKLGLSMHCPAAAHDLHSVALAWLSTHAPSLQTSQVAGQFLNMYAEFDSHSPFAAQPGQLSSTSLQVYLHTPQLTGHLRDVNSGFFSHSPRCAQPAHSGSKSLHSGVQMPQLVGQ